MGTRSTVHFYEESRKVPILSVYQQFDGYPSGVGLELAEFLSPFIVVNGFGTDEVAGTHANGAGCLAAQFVAKFKTSIGGFYITDRKDRQEYDYHVWVKEGKDFLIKVEDHKNLVFTGDQCAFLKWCKAFDE